jgi:flagellar protein FliL
MTTTTARENRWASAGGAAKQDTATGTAAGAAAAAPGRKGSRLTSKKFLLAVIALLVLGGGAYTFLKPASVARPSGGDVVTMDATTLNLAGGHYLKVSVSLQLVKGKASATDFQSSHAAELTIDQFSNRTVASLSSNAARKKLTAELLTSIQKAYPGQVFDVFLTQFVTQ